MLKIALTCSMQDQDWFLRQRYTKVLLDCARTAGIAVMPVILPIAEGEELMRAYAEEFDGFLITGGNDIAPARYGEETLPECGTIHEERDHFELDLLRAVVRTGKPIFGICRGIQTINVFFGGSLWQDIPSQLAHLYTEGKAHCTRDENGTPRHPVHLSGSLAALIGEETISVTSFHHQSIKDAAPGMRVTAVSEEGIVEAAEHTAYPYCRAVQWHPEVAPDEYSQKLFEDFLKAVQKSKEGSL